MNRETAAIIFNRAAKYLDDLYELATKEELQDSAYGIQDIDEMYMLATCLMRPTGSLESLLENIYNERLLQHAADIVREFLDPDQEYREFYQALEARHIERFPILRLDRKPTMD